MYTASIHYTEQTVMLMAKVVSNAFGGYKKIIAGVVGVAMVAAGALSGGTAGFSVVMVCIGCLIITNINIQQQRLGRRMCGVLSNWWPIMEYVFDEDKLVSATDRETLETEYKDVITLIEADGYLFLLIERNRAFMVDAATIQPKDLDGFKAMLSDKCGCKWRQSGGGLYRRLTNRLQQKQL